MPKNTRHTDKTLGNFFDSDFIQNISGSKMDFLFGRKKTPAEMLRQNQRALNKAMRELDRERSRLEIQEKKIIADIKKMAKMNQMVGNTFKISITNF